MEAFITWFRSNSRISAVPSSQIHAVLQLAVSHPELAQSLVTFARQHKYKEYVKTVLEEDVVSARDTITVERVMGS